MDLKNNEKIGKIITDTIAIGMVIGALFRNFPHIPKNNSTAVEIVSEHKNAILDINLETVIDDFYNKCFKTYTLDNELITLRIPFGQNDERSKDRDDYFQRFIFEGKGTPEQIWNQIDAVWNSNGFQKYLEGITGVNDILSGNKVPKEKVIQFNLQENSFAFSSDPKLIRKMKQGKYPGNDTNVFILKQDSQIKRTDIYNYLYCVASIGIDCSGLVYNAEKSLARSLGYDLDAIVSEERKMPSENIAIYTSTKFYDPRNGHTTIIDDKISNLRPGDIILFMGKENEYKHSAVIQSVNFIDGKIRYIQSTDWAPQSERGVHESYITFDPKYPDISLKDKSTEWSQKLNSTFKGESPIGWKTDKDRFLSYPEYGGSVIVRLNAMKKILESVKPDFYSGQYNIHLRVIKEE